MSSVRFSPGVEIDLDQAVAWYDRQERGLGDRFLDAFRTTVDKSGSVGGSLRKSHGEFRHLKFDRFPYFAYCRDDGGGFYVTLVVNAARSPALVSQLLRARL